jgi:hypothetical protein
MTRLCEWPLSKRDERITQDSRKIRCHQMRFFSPEVISVAGGSWDMLLPEPRRRWQSKMQRLQLTPEFSPTLNL